MNINKNAYEYALNMLESLLLQNPDKIKYDYIICDIFCLNMIDTFFDFKKLGEIGLINYSEISEINLHTVTVNGDVLKNFKDSEKKICYIILPCEENYHHLKNQVSIFNNNVSVLFVDDISEFKFKLITELKNVVSMKKVLLNMNIFDKKLVTTDNESQLECLLNLIGDYTIHCMEGYDKTRFTNFEEDQNRETKSDSVVIMLKRTYDVRFPFIIPWSYESMLNYHFRIVNNKVRIEDNDIRLDPHTDPLYDKLKYCDASDVLTIVDEGLELKLHDQRLTRLFKLHEYILETIDTVANKNNCIRAHSIQEKIVKGLMTFEELSKTLISNPILSRVTLITVLALANNHYNNKEEIEKLAQKLGFNSDDINGFFVQSECGLITVNTIQNKKLKEEIFQPNLSVILDCIFDRNGFKFNPKFMKPYDYSNVKNIIIHIDEYVTYEEKRIIDTYKCGDVNLMLHSDRII